MAVYMHFCKECKKVYKVKGIDKNVKCPNCMDKNLYSTGIPFERWMEYNPAQKAFAIEDMINQVNRSGFVENAGDDFEKDKSDTVENSKTAPVETGKPETDNENVSDDEYYIYACEKCRTVFKAKGKDKKIRCRKCSDITVALNITEKEWNEQKEKETQEETKEEEAQEKKVQKENVVHKEEEDRKEAEQHGEAGHDKPTRPSMRILVGKDQKMWVDEVARNMRKDDKKKKKAQKKIEEESTDGHEGQDSIDEIITKENPKPFTPKVTNLLFYRQYNTYQALFDAYPEGEMSVDECFSKIILYIMKWFKDRIGEESLSSVPEVSFLNTDYPDPDKYKSFDITGVSDINALSVIDVKTAYMEKKNAWVFQLVEPDNGNEKRDIHGRVFTTNICVYKKDRYVVFGAKTSCKEPVTNTQDADVYRPGFIRTISKDPDIELSEAGVPYEYRFKKEPTLLNGKSSTECNAMYEGLIANPCRQLPILFVPEEIYFGENEDGSLKEKIDGKTVSLLGFCHVIVWTRSNQKLFGQVMNSQELVEVSSEGQMIIYRSNPGNSLELEPSYFEADDEDKYTVIDSVLKKTDPLRRTYNFREYDLVADHWDTEKVLQLITSGNIDDSEEMRLVKADRDRLKADIENFKRDSQEVQQRNNELQQTINDLEKQRDAALVDAGRKQKESDKYKREYKTEKDKRKSADNRCYILERTVNGANDFAREKFLPLLHFPRFEIGAKEEILAWIEEYYSDSIIIHENARKSFMKDNRNIDWRLFCMMIHYLSGYTKYRNDGGNPSDNSPARDYDPDNYGFACTPSSSGAGGSKNIYSSEYSINISKFDDEKDEVILDMHIAKGKGRGEDMIRIYFYYDPQIEKSIVGYMPDHLKTRSMPH